MSMMKLVDLIDTIKPNQYIELSVADKMPYLNRIDLIYNGIFNNTYFKDLVGIFLRNSVLSVSAEDNILKIIITNS